MASQHALSAQGADGECQAVCFPISKHATYPPDSQAGRRGSQHGRLTPGRITDSGDDRQLETIERASVNQLALGAALAVLPVSGTATRACGIISLGTRSIAIFSCDHLIPLTSAQDAAQIINTVATKPAKQGSIILMHDFQKHTAEALPTLLRRLKAGGYKVVQMKAKAPLETLAEYDEALGKDMKVPVASTRPVSSVVQTVSE